MAGGFATRLWPITKTKAKPLLPLGKKVIIDHIYEKLKKFNVPIIVSTNKRFQEDFETWADGKDVELVVENSTKEEEKLGAVKALAEVSKIADDDLIVIAGDNVFSFGLEKFIEYYRQKRSPVIALYDVGDYELARRYGVAEIMGEKIVRFYEKPEKPKSTLVGIGIYAFPKDSLELLVNYARVNEKPDNLGDFMSWLCEREEVYGFIFNGVWYDVGSADSYIEALKLYMETNISEKAKIDITSKIIPPVVIEDGCSIKGRSMIGPYAYIGRNCLVENSDISESVVFDRVVLRRVKIWRSIIDESCEIRNIELSSSIIGGHAKIQMG